MVRHISYSPDQLERLLQPLICDSARAEPEIAGRVTEILNQFRTTTVEGRSQALLDYTARWDGWAPENFDQLRVRSDDVVKAYRALGGYWGPDWLSEDPDTSDDPDYDTKRLNDHPDDSEIIRDLKLAARRIRTYHARQKPALDASFPEEDIGVTLGWRWTPLSSVGLYVPGGQASYPSSVLMNALPARIAGVRNMIMTVPAPGGTVNPLVLAAAFIAGVTEVYKVGGAQAIAALTYGAGGIQPVAKIVGPGNAYVAEAKRQVVGEVGIDLIAGPSEVMILADDTAHLDWIAWDLLAQAEHDVRARALLVTDSPRVKDGIEAAVAAALTKIKDPTRRSIAQESWDKKGAIIFVENLERDGAVIVNRLRPEHLQIITRDPKRFLIRTNQNPNGLIRHAGAIFLGPYMPEALGDYVAGSNHVLPTQGGAFSASGLSLLDFMKRSSVLEGTWEGLRALGPAAARLAQAEGLEAHAASITQRLSADPEGET